MTSRLVVTALAAILCGAASQAHAQNSASYEKCRAMLQKQADKHRKKAASLRAKFQSRRNEALTRAKSQSFMTAEDAAALQTAIERMIGRSQVEEGWQVYVEDATTQLSTIVGDPGGDIECAKRGGLSVDYNANLDRYEELLKALDQDVKDRLELETLGPNEGLAIIAFNANIDSDEVFIDRLGALGGITLYPQRRGEHFRVLKVKAGRYNWNRITQYFWRGRSWYEFSDRRLRFNVEAGKLTYTGVLMHEVNSRGYSTTRLHDRLTIVLLALEQRYPELLRKYDLANGLYPDDPFIDFYLAEKNSTAASDD